MSRGLEVSSVWTVTVIGLIIKRSQILELRRRPSVLHAVARLFNDGGLAQYRKDGRDRDVEPDLR